MFVCSFIETPTPFLIHLHSQTSSVNITISTIRFLCVRLQGCPLPVEPREGTFIVLAGCRFQMWHLHGSHICLNSSASTCVLWPSIMWTLSIFASNWIITWARNSFRLLSYFYYHRDSSLGISCCHTFVTLKCFTNVGKHESTQRVVPVIIKMNLITLHHIWERTTFQDPSCMQWPSIMSNPSFLHQL